MKKENISDIVEEVFESGSRLAINMLLPIIGPIINEISDLPSRLSKKRKDRYFEAVITQLERINENLIDKDFINSDDFVDIIQAIVNQITLRQAAQKAEFFATLSVANMLQTRPHCALDWQCRFIEIIAKLNESEMYLLTALNAHRAPGEASLSGVSTPFGLERTEFELCFDSLISQGLVYDASLLGMPNATHMGIGGTPRPRERINISPLAKKAISFIPEVEQIVKNAMKK